MVPKPSISDMLMDAHRLFMEMDEEANILEDIQLVFQDGKTKYNSLLLAVRFPYLVDCFSFSASVDQVIFPSQFLNDMKSWFTVDETKLYQTKAIVEYVNFSEAELHEMLQFNDNQSIHLLSPESIEMSTVATDQFARNEAAQFQDEFANEDYKLNSRKSVPNCYFERPKFQCVRPERFNEHIRSKSGSSVMCDLCGFLTNNQKSLNNHNTYFPFRQNMAPDRPQTKNQNKHAKTGFSTTQIGEEIVAIDSF